MTCALMKAAEQMRHQLDSDFERYWSASYDLLDERYQLLKRHNVGKFFYMRNPLHYHRWINIYFSNPGLFDLGDSGHVKLLPFLVDPETLFFNLQCRQRSLLIKPRIDVVMEAQWSMKRLFRKASRLPVLLRGNRLQQAIERPRKRICNLSTEREVL